jgi:hypothetical protein
MRFLDLYPRRLSGVAVIACAAATLMGACTDDQSESGTVTTHSDLYLNGQTYPDGTVPVCYDPTDGNDPSLLSQARTLIDNSWSLAANISFIGWGECNYSAVSPPSSVALHFVANSNGLTGRVGLVPPSSTAAGFDSVTLISNDTTAHNVHFRYEAVHEFGHALGFDHEQERPDNWDGTSPIDCSQVQGTRTAIPGGTYETPYFDTSSIMDYCAGWTTQLSAGDINGIRAVYPGRSTASYGFLPSRSGNPTGYVRATDDSSIGVFTNPSGHIREFNLSTAAGSHWGVNDLTAIAVNGKITGAPIAASAPSAYVRHDGINAVVYRAPDNEIVELAFASGVWQWSYLAPAMPVGLPLAASDATPTGFKRSDGHSAVVYRTAANQIAELVLGSSWTWTYLAPTGTPAAASDPVAYVRSDFADAVNYRSTANHIIELALVSTGWVWSDLTDSASGSPPLASGTPAGYLRSDGVNAVVYRNASGGGLTELSIGPGDTQWSAASLPNGGYEAASDPVAFQAAFANNAVLYRSGSNQIIEIKAPVRGAWSVFNLSSVAMPAVPAATGKPSAFVRADGISAVMFQDPAGDVYDLYYLPPATSGESFSWKVETLGV